MLIFYHFTYFPDCENDILPGLCGSEKLHEEVILANLPQMVDDIELKNTLLIDQLIQDDCLSSDEGSKIRNAGDRQDQTRELCKIISRRSSEIFVKFSRRLSERNNYPHIAELLNASYSKSKQKFLQNRNKICISCAITDKVEIKDVVDVLLQGHVLEWDFLNKMKKSDNSELWPVIFERIQYADDIMNSFSCLRTALLKKHPEIATLLPTVNQHQYQMKCYCKYFSRKEKQANASTLPSYSDAYSSAGYVKTTTEEKEKSVDAVEYSDLLTVPSSKVLSVTKKTRSHTNIQEWLERNDTEYDQAFPDPTPKINESHYFQLSRNHSVNILKDEDNITRSKEQEQIPNLEEVAVTYLSRCEEKERLEGDIDRTQQICTKGTRAKTKKSSRNRKRVTINVNDNRSSDDNVRSEKHGESEIQSHPFQHLKSDVFSLPITVCNNRDNDEARCVDSEQKSKIMFDMFKVDAQTQNNQTKKKEDENLSNKNEETLNIVKENTSIHMQNNIGHSASKTAEKPKSTRNSLSTKKKEKQRHGKNKR